ncbi:MAG: trigger factor [Ginsengibacter sp.]
MATVTRENLSLLNDKLTVKINKEDYYPSFEKAIKDYSKKANIPGFRKGMVPAGMVKKMYGASIYYDEVIKVVEKEIQSYLTTEKPDIFAQPLPLKSDLRDLDMNNPQDYEFPFEIGLKPSVEIDALAKANLTFYKVKVTDEMINTEIDRLKSRHGKMTEPEIVDNEDNVLNVTFTESDQEGNVTEGGILKDNSLLLKYFTEDYRKQITGKKKDDNILIQLSKAFGDKEREWLMNDLGLDKEDGNTGEKYFNMLITKIGYVEKRELDEDFYNEAFPGKELKTEEDFRKEIAMQIQQVWDAQSRNQLHDQIYHLLLDIPMDFPDEFLKKWLQKGGEKEKSPEDVEKEFPSFTNQLKWTLISDKIINENNLSVSQEELRDSMRNEILQYFGQVNPSGDMSWIDSYIDRMMKDEKQLDSSYRRLITEKLFKWAETQVKPAEQEVSSDELTGMQHNHQH